MAQKKNNTTVHYAGKVITLEAIEEAVKKMADEGGKPELVMPPQAWSDFQRAIRADYIELKVGDWLFVNTNDHSYVCEITEVVNSLRNYKAHIKESTETKRSLYLMLHGNEDIKKVAKGSKLKTLQVLHGKR